MTSFLSPSSSVQVLLCFIKKGNIARIINAHNSRSSYTLDLKWSTDSSKFFVVFSLTIGHTFCSFRYLKQFKSSSGLQRWNGVGITKELDLCYPLISLQTFQLSYEGPVSVCANTFAL